VSTVDVKPRSRRTLLLGLVVGLGIVLSPCLALQGVWLFRRVFPPPRPMFHDAYVTPDHGFFDYWMQNTYCADDHGNYGLLDRHLNLFLLVLTGVTHGEFGNPPGAGNVPRLHATPDSAVLFGQTPFETRIGPMQDTLLIIATDKTQQSYKIPAGAAQKWYLNWRNGQKGNLAREIAGYGEPPLRESTLEFIRKHCPPFTLIENDETDKEIATSNLGEENVK
jgi:hypothetical protein